MRRGRMRANRLSVPANVALLFWAAGMAALAAQATTARTSTAGMRMSDAEKAYVAPQATTRVGDAARKANFKPTYGAKFSAEPGIGGEVTITNPYMDPATMIFAKTSALRCATDGAL